jgi:hypothetical protein
MEGRDFTFSCFFCSQFPPSLPSPSIGKSLFPSSFSIDQVISNVSITSKSARRGQGEKREFPYKQEINMENAKDQNTFSIGESGEKSELGVRFVGLGLGLGLGLVLRLRLG